MVFYVFKESAVNRSLIFGWICFFLTFQPACTGPERKANIDLQAQTQVFDSHTGQYTRAELDAVKIGETFRAFEQDDFLKKQLLNVESDLSRIHSKRMLEIAEDARLFYNAIVNKNFSSAEELAQSLSDFYGSSSGSSYQLLAEAALKRVLKQLPEKTRTPLISKLESQRRSFFPKDESTDLAVPDKVEDERLQAEFISSLQELEKLENFDVFFNKIILFSKEPRIQHLDLIVRNRVFQAILGSIKSPTPEILATLDGLLRDHSVSPRSKILLAYALAYRPEGPFLFTQSEAIEKIVRLLEEYILSFSDNKLKSSFLRIQVARKRMLLARQSFARGDYQRFTELSHKIGLDFAEISSKDEQDLPTEFWQDSGEFKLLNSIFLAMVKNRVEDAVSLLLESLKEERISSQLRSRMGWMIGFYRLLQNQPHEAISFWQSENFMQNQDADNPRLMYWLGKAYLATGDLVHANFYFTGAVSSSSASYYYSLLSFNKMIENDKTRSWFESRDRLREALLKGGFQKEKGSGWSFFWSPGRFQDFEVGSSSASNDLLTLAFECIRSGKKELLADIFQVSSEKSFTGGLVTEQKKLFAVTLSRLLLASGHYREASRALSRFGTTTVDVSDKFPDQYLVDYPLTEFFHEISGRSRDNAVDPALVLSLAKELTEFDPTLISAGPKVGMLQLRPRDNSPENIEILLNPRENLTVGIGQIAEGMRRQDSEISRLVLFLFGYHLPLQLGGGEAVKDRDHIIELLDEFLPADILRRVIVSREIYKDYFPENLEESESLVPSGVDL